MNSERQADLRELAGGLLLSSFGAFVAVYALRNYEWGQGGQLGPGFFPAVLGVTLVVLGVIIVLFSFTKTSHVLTPPPFRLRPFLAIVCAIAAFALSLERLGLFPSTALLTGIAVLAERPYKLRRTFLLACSLALMSWLIFVKGLDMQLSAFGVIGG